MSVWALTRHHGYLEGVGGLRLHYRTWEPAEPRAAVLLVHGLGEHGGRYASLAERLAGHGIVTVAPDLRGHGRSDGRRGHVTRFEVFLQDLDRFRREAQGLLDPGCRLFLLGHGLGGVIVLRYLEEFDPPVRGAILSSPWVTAGAPVAPGLAALARVLDPVFPAVRLRTRFHAGLLTRDPAGGVAFHEDPLVHDAVTPRLLRELQRAIDTAVQRRARLAAPLFVLLGDDDPIAPPDRTVAFLRSLDDAAFETRRYAGRRHDLLIGAAAEDVHSDLVIWLEDRLDAAESAAGPGIGLAPPWSAHHVGARP